MCQQSTLEGQAHFIIFENMSTKCPDLNNQACPSCFGYNWCSDTEAASLVGNSIDKCFSWDGRGSSVGSRGPLAASHSSHRGTPKGSYHFYAHQKYSQVNVASFLTWMCGGEEHGDAWWCWYRCLHLPSGEAVPWLL